MSLSILGHTVFSTVPNLTAFLTLAVTILAQEQAPSPSNTSHCRAIGKIVRLPDLPEASGVAASRRAPAVLWAHNDSGAPMIFALDHQGAVKGRVRVNGASVDDWEDIAVGPCSGGSCVYIADIGDNDGKRKHITLYRVSEPAPGDAATDPVDVFHATYPDGPHDAESLFVTRDSDVFLITKGDPGPVALYRFPRPLASDRTLSLQRIGEPMGGQQVDQKDRPTAADASPDGQWVIVRTTDWIRFYRTVDLISGRWRDAFRTDLSSLNEPRGEGAAFVGNDALVLVGEGAGPFGNPGTLAWLACTLPAR
jgi:hypothetical protein